MPIHGNPDGRETVGKSLKAQHSHRMFSVGESNSHPRKRICSQPKNRTAPTTSVHLAFPRLNLFPNETYSHFIETITAEKQTS